MATPEVLDGAGPLPDREEADSFIEEFLAAEQAKDLLRFSTAGSVDDGKSTLIGRLLYDSQNVYEDHVRAVTRTHGGSVTSIDFAQLTDGLRAEREQGITIDVAYRYFSTARRKFIIADTPGHEQYTRNMATGASTADLAIILVDARKGILIQSRRHSYIASLLGIRHVVAAINKMDLVGYAEEVYEQHRQALMNLAASLAIEDLVCIPVSALEGDNVVTRSARMPWYAGPSLLEHLEAVPVFEDRQTAPFRMPVQRVIRPHQNFRGFAGQIAAGCVRLGDTVVALPSGNRSRVASISTFDGDLDVATAPLSITLTLEDELDISRGEMIVAEVDAPAVANRFGASIVWMSPTALETGKTYLLKHTTQVVRAVIPEVKHRVDIHTLAHEASSALEMNEIGMVEIETSRPLFLDAYGQNRITGSFILIDSASNATVGAGMVRRVTATTHQPGPASLPAAWARTAALIDTGGRAGLAAELERALLELSYAVVRTRVHDRTVWQALLDAGVIAILEHEELGADRNAPLRLLTSSDSPGSFDSETLAVPADSSSPSIVAAVRAALDNTVGRHGRRDP
jgi:sulfate adenylyltransferase subunit 1